MEENYDLFRFVMAKIEGSLYSSQYLLITLNYLLYKKYSKIYEKELISLYLVV